MTTREELLDKLKRLNNHPLSTEEERNQYIDMAFEAGMSEGRVQGANAINSALSVLTARKPAAV